jgi:hypothetical protein
MGQTMNMNDPWGDPASCRVIEEIAFQASILALHAAIESAAKGDSSAATGDTAAGQLDDQVHRLVDRARRPASHTDSIVRPDLRGF